MTSLSPGLTGAVAASAFAGAAFATLAGVGEAFFTSGVAAVLGVAGSAREVLEPETSLAVCPSSVALAGGADAGTGASCTVAVSSFLAIAAGGSGDTALAAGSEAVGLPFAVADGAAEVDGAGAAEGAGVPLTADLNRPKACQGSSPDHQYQAPAPPKRIRSKITRYTRPCPVLGSSSSK